MKKFQVAVVTGAIKGIGLAIAKCLLKRGVKCIVTYYDWLDDLEAMHTRLSATGTDYRAIQADLRTEAGARDTVGAAIETFGRLDILINNIERGGWPVVHGPYTQEQWDLEFQTTVTAKWHLFNNALPHLKKSSSGCVVNITSISGITGRIGPAGLVFNDCYSLSNRAVGLLTEQWARMGAPNVRVNELMLGFMETRHGPGTRGWGVLSEEQKKALINHALLKRTGTLDDVTRAVEFLVFNSPFMTGTRIVLDGGYLLGGEGVPRMPKGVVEPGESVFGGSKPPKGS